MALGSEGEAMHVDGSLGSLLADPLAFIERVFQHVQDQLMDDDSANGDSKPADEWLAAVLGNQLARLIGKEDLSVEEEWSADARRNEYGARWKEVAARDAALGAALGACNCWGQRADCPICEGFGAPGWVLPDEELYASYVYPAVIAATNPGDFGTAELRATERKM
jgi:hypothetical protein